MAEKMFLVPLTNIPQEFDITLGGVQLTIVNKWNEYSGWLIDIYSGTTAAPLAMAIPLVVGADLFSQLRYLGLPGIAAVYTDGDQYAAPTLDNLGAESNLYVILDVV